MWTDGRSLIDVLGELGSTSRRTGLQDGRTWCSLGAGFVCAWERGRDEMCDLAVGLDGWITKKKFRPGRVQQLAARVTEQSVW